MMIDVWWLADARGHRRANDNVWWMTDGEWRMMRTLDITNDESSEMGSSRVGSRPVSTAHLEHGMDTGWEHDGAGCEEIRQNCIVGTWTMKQSPIKIERPAGLDLHEKQFASNSNCMAAMTIQIPRPPGENNASHRHFLQGMGGPKACADWIHSFYLFFVCTKRDHTQIFL